MCLIFDLDILKGGKLILHEFGKEAGFTSINEFIDMIRNMPMSDENYYGKHIANFKGVQFQWNVDFPAVSGQCPKCKKTITGFTIESRNCNGQNCNFNNLTLTNLPKKWFWAQFKCIDVIGDKEEHVLMANHEFSKQIIKKLTTSRICNVNDYIKHTHNGADFANLMQQQKFVKITTDCSVSVIRKKISNQPIGSENLVIQVDSKKETK